MIEAIHYHFRMARGLLQMVREPKLADPDSLVRDQIVHRSERFLALLASTVFADPTHPYAIMFRLAGCTREDFEKLVRTEGLEPALAAIHQAGVYLRHQELKGREPIVRSGQEIFADEKSFINPAGYGAWEVVSSGTTSGIRARFNASGACLTWRAMYPSIVRREFEADGQPQVAVMPILPAPHVFSSAVRYHRAGLRLNQWFADGGTLRDSAHYRLATNLLVLESRMLGVRAPFPEYLPAHDFKPVARWIARHGASFVLSNISTAVYVSAAAQELGIDLSGTTFHGGGEPITLGKRAAIQKSGARCAPAYRTNDVGSVGFACSHYPESDAMHLMEDSLAAISHRRIAPLSAAAVNSLLFTTLLPVTPRLYLNLDLDDIGEIVPATCQCEFSKLGYRKLVRNVSSIGRLTGHGTTLIGTDILQILEHDLPTAFGGVPGDYQLVEDDRATGATLIVLRFHPRLGELSETAVRDFFLGRIRRLFGGAVTVRGWQHGDSVRVVRQEPYVGFSGKRLPLILSRHKEHNAP